MNLPVIDMKGTGLKIKEKVKENGYSAEEIKELLGLNDKSNVYKWFRGETLPSVDNFLALSVLLNVSINDLLDNTAA